MRKFYFLVFVAFLISCSSVEESDIKDEEYDQGVKQEDIDENSLDTGFDDENLNLTYADCEEVLELTPYEDGTVYYRTCLIGRVEKIDRDNCSFCEGDCADNCVCPATSTRSHVSVNDGEGFCSENIQCQGPSDCEDGGLCMVSYTNCGSQVTGIYCSTANDDCRSEKDCCNARGEELDDCGSLCFFDVNLDKWTCSSLIDCQ